MKDFDRLYSRLMEENAGFDLSISSNRTNRFVYLYFLCLNWTDFSLIKDCGYNVLSVSPSYIDAYPIEIVLS